MNFKSTARLKRTRLKHNCLLILLLSSFSTPLLHSKQCTPLPSGTACTIPIDCSGTLLAVPCNDCFTPLKGSACPRTPRCDTRRCQFGATSLYLLRPQGLNSMVFFDPFRYNACVEQPLTNVLMLGYRYNQTFHNNHIAECLFGAECLSFSGSKAPQRRETDFVADYFGLSPELVVSLCLEPSIKNHIVDFSATWQLGNWVACLSNTYITINSSLVQSIWSLKTRKESNPTAVSSFTNFPSCYMASQEVQSTQSISTALSGDFLFGNMQDEWQFGRFVFDRSQKKTALANIDILLGYDFYRCTDYHAGLFFVVSGPTGNRPDSRTVFAPIVGNGHHVGVGAGVDAHYDFWYCQDKSLSLFINGTVSHLCSDTQWRSFDLKSSTRGIRGIDSRYVLLKEFNDTLEYTGRLINAINFTTRPIESSFDAIGDASLRLVYRNNCWATGLGYNIYGRTAESISRTKCSNRFTNRQFGIKGITGVCAEAWQPATGLTGASVPLSSTASQARIFTVPELPFLTDNPVQLKNIASNTFYLNWDSPSDAVIPINQLVIAQDSLVDNQAAPVLLTDADIDLKGIPSQIAHSFFAHVDYLWPDCAYQPALGIGGYVSFAQNGSCRVCTSSEWSVWLRGSCCF